MTSNAKFFSGQLPNFVLWSAAWVPHPRVASFRWPSARTSARRVVVWGRDAPLPARYLELHSQIIREKKPMNGRCGAYVYYWAYGRLCWHRYVDPKDPRTARQQRSRAAFGAASEAWSENQRLTQVQRDAWSIEAAKTSSHPRLMQSGHLTAQQHFLGCNAVKERWSMALLLEPPKGSRKQAEGRRQKADAAVHAQPFARTASASNRRFIAGTPSVPLVVSPCSRKGLRSRASSQVAIPQLLTRPSSEHLLSASGCLPGQYRWQARSHADVGRPSLPPWSAVVAHIRQTARARALWRGG
jgi:hypothetical protein